MAFIYTVQMLGKKWRFRSWRLCHWTIKTLHIWFLCDWFIKCKQTLCFLPLFICYCWVEGGLELVWIETGVMSQCPTALLQAGWAMSSRCGSFLFRGKGPGYLTCFMPAHPALNCFQTLPVKISPVWQSQPVAADRAGYQHVRERSLPGQHVKVGWVSLCRAPEKSQVPQASSHQLLYWTLGLGCARVSHSRHPSHTCAMGTNEVWIGKS